MADDKCVEAVEGEVTETGQDTPCPSSTPPPRPVFLVPALDDPQQRQQVLAKVKEFLASGVLNTFTFFFSHYINTFLSSVVFHSRSLVTSELKHLSQLLH